MIAIKIICIILISALYFKFLMWMNGTIKEDKDEDNNSNL